MRLELRKRPALVPTEESARLTDLMSAVVRREAVVLQGGDCAELFEDAAPSPVHRKLEQLYGLSGTLRGRLGLYLTRTTARGGCGAASSLSAGSATRPPPLPNR